jgi:hypothetical protein
MSRQAKWNALNDDEEDDLGEQDNIPLHSFPNSRSGASSQATKQPATRSTRHNDGDDLTFDEHHDYDDEEEEEEEDGTPQRQKHKTRGLAQRLPQKWKDCRLVIIALLVVLVIALLAAYFRLLATSTSTNATVPPLVCMGVVVR